MCYNFMMNSEINISGQAEYEQKPKLRDIILHVVLIILVFGQVTMIFIMPCCTGRLDGLMFFFMFPLAYFWWRFIIRLGNPEKAKSRMKWFKERGLHFNSTVFINPRMPIKDRFILEKRMFLTLVIVLSLCMHVVAFFALKSRFESKSLFITTQSITGFIIWLLMVALVIYIKLKWEEKLFSSKQIVTTGLIYQNMLLALILLVS